MLLSELLLRLLVRLSDELALELLLLEFELALELDLELLLLDFELLLLDLEFLDLGLDLSLIRPSCLSRRSMTSSTLTSGVVSIAESLRSCFSRFSASLEDRRNAFSLARVS